MHDYNQTARSYWWIVAAIGYGVLAYALFSVVARPAAEMLQIGLIVVFICAVAFFPVRIPGTTMSFSGGEIFIFLALLLFGVEAATIAAALEGAIGAARTSKRWTSWFATPAMAAIATATTGYSYLAVQTALEQNGFLSGAATLLLMTGFAMLYFALSNILPSMLLAFKRSEFLDVPGLLRDRSWMAVAHLCSLAVASLVHLAAPGVDAWILLSALPVIFLLHWTAHATLEQADTELHA